MLARIQQNRKAAVCPQIDNIHAETLTYTSWKFGGSIGTFTWNGHFSWSYRESAKRGDQVSAYP